MEDKVKKRSKSKDKVGPSDKKEKSGQKLKSRDDSNHRKPEKRTESKEKIKDSKSSVKSGKEKESKTSLRSDKDRKEKPADKKPERSRSKDAEKKTEGGRKKDPEKKKRNDHHEKPTKEKDPKKSSGSSSKSKHADSPDKKSTKKKKESSEKSKKEPEEQRKNRDSLEDPSEKSKKEPEEERIDQSLRETYLIENGITPEEEEEEPDEDLKTEKELGKDSLILPSDPVVKEESNFEAENDEDEGYDYEDDFEDYEEDFEEDDEDEEIQNPESSRGSDHHQSEKEDSSEEEESYAEEKKDKAGELKSPMRTVGSGSSRKTDSAASSGDPQRPPSVQSRIDFSRASATEVPYGSIVQSRKREKEILNLVDMDTVSFEIFDMAPVRDYQFYMQTFGKSNRIQIQTQTGDDCIERDIQTEEVDSEAKWTQHPPTDLHGSGGENEVKTFENSDVHFDSEVFNSSRFRKFVEKTGQLICDLLEEESASQPMLIQHKSDIKFSEGFSTISLGILAKESTVTSVTFSPAQSSCIAISFYVQESVAEDLVGRGIVGIWTVTDPETPSRLFLCDLLPNCCCFSPEKNSAVFAGLDDGSVVAWDFLESESLHKTIPWKDDEIALRSPTYDTSFTGSIPSSSLDSNSDSCILSPIVSICSIGAQNTATESDSGVNGYQLACLEDHGIVHIWTVIDSSSSDPSELDLGLSPGGKLKLIKSATVRPSSVALRCLSPDANLRTATLQSFTMAQNPSRPSHFYIGTDVGFILHLYRHKDRAGPLVYQSELEALSDVLCMDVSPFESSLLLAGSSDGSISLYKMSESRPLVSFRLSADQNGVESDLPITQIHWCPMSPYVFYAIHGAGRLLSKWDLKQNRKKPTALQVVSSPSQAPCLGVSLPTDTPGSAQCNFLALGRKSGDVEVHLLEKRDRKLSRNEEGHKLLRFVDWVTGTGTWGVESQR